MFSLDEGSPRRPVKRILVLSGSAGLGKTTLAAIAARMVGYSVVETNASDSRTVADLERVVESAGRSTRTLDGVSSVKYMSYPILWDVSRAL